MKHKSNEVKSPYPRCKCTKVKCKLMEHSLKQKRNQRTVAKQVERFRYISNITAHSKHLNEKNQNTGNYKQTTHILTFLSRKHFCCGAQIYQLPICSHPLMQYTLIFLPRFQLDPIKNAINFKSSLKYRIIDLFETRQYIQQVRGRIDHKNSVMP